MPPKKIVMAIAAFSFLLFSRLAQAQYSESNVSYQDLSPSEQNELNSSFVDHYPTNYTYSSPRENIEPKHSPRIHKVHEAHEMPVKMKTKDTSSETYSYNLPRKITTTEKVILVDPNIHAWGAYSAEGELLHAGMATAGSKWCPDIHRPCKTKSGTFRISSLGSSDCVSTKYPVGEGGAPMPYCMYFNGSQGLHGSNEVVDGNISHGCVRLRVRDARWLRYNFSDIGTKVVIKQY